MNENINLCKILKGLEGIELYSTIFGVVFLEQIKYPIVIVRCSKCLSFSFNYKGFYYDSNYPEAECTLFPSKEQRDWSKFERPIPIDTPVMCKNEKDNIWSLYYIALHCGKYGVFSNGLKSNNTNLILLFPKYMIPFDKFDPNNIEESLKYNIQK